MKKLLSVLVAVLMIVMLAPTAFADDNASTPSTDTPQITDTPQPTDIVQPSDTPQPTITPAPTPELTVTPEPTATPEPAGKAQAKGLLQETDTSGDYDFIVNQAGTTCTITGYTGSETSITIPDTLTEDSDTYTVTQIGESAFSGGTLTAITVSSNVTEIGAKAFYNCTSLQTVVLHEGLLTIDDEAFRICTSLKSISLPDSLTKIGEYAFGTCTSLGNINLPPNVTLARDSFFACTSIRELIVPENANISFYQAFCECWHLRAVYFRGDAPTNFVSFVFYDCAPGFTIYHLADNKSFSNPWNGYATAEYNPSLTHKVSFDLNGIDGATTTPDVQTLYDGVKAFEPDGFTLAGYNLHWYTDSRCQDETEWDFNTPVTQDMTLFAKWEIITYTITYYLNGGEVDPATPNPTTYTVLTPTFTLSNPTKASYHFIGWNGRDSDKMTVTVPQGSYGNLEFDAYYEGDNVYAYLSGMDVKHGTLSPNFDSHSYEYKVLLDKGWSYSDITLTPINVADTITVNGIATTSFRLSAGVGLAQKVDIAVSYAGNYTVHYSVTAESRSSDAYLSGISAMEYISPCFRPDILNYTVWPGYYNDTTEVSVTPDDPFATIKVNGEDCTDNHNIDIGFVGTGKPQLLSIEVTAPDGVTKKTYTVTITESRNNPYIRDMYGWDPAYSYPSFDPYVTTYYLKQSEPYPAWVDLYVFDEGCTVKLNGKQIGSKSNGTLYVIEIAKNDANIPHKAVVEITAPDGAKKTYTFKLWTSSPPTLKTPSLTVKATDRKTVQLSWKAVPNALGYEVYMSSGGSYTKIETVNGITSYTEPWLTAGVKYSFKVRAYWEVLGVTKYSSYSSVKSVKLAWPTINLKASAKDYDSIALNWNIVVGASGYEVYRCPTAKGTYAYIGESTANSYMDDSAVTGVTHYYKVRAYDLIDGARVYSPYSSYQYAKTVPDVPSDLTLTPSGTTINVSWDVTNGAAGYEVYRATSLKGTYVKVTTTADTSYEDQGLTAGKTYYYKVRAYCVVGKTKVYGSYTLVSSLKV